VFSLHIDTARPWNGGQGQVMSTVLGLRALGHRAALVAHPEGMLLERMRDGMDLFALAPHAEIDLGAAWWLSRVLKQLRPDVVHAHEPRAVAMASTALSMAAPEPRPPLVVSRRSEFRLASNSFARWKYSEVDCFIASSAAIRDRLVGDGVARERTVVIHPGIDIEHVAAVPAANVHAEFFLPVHAPVVGNVAALNPQKGHHHLVEAAALVLRAVPDARFIIVGDGELRAALEKQVKDKHLERHVFVAGSRTDSLALIKGFDVFVLSSITEGMSIPLIDAMAASRPALGTSAGGIPEAIEDGETGFLVPPRDEQAMADKLVLLLKDDARRAQMGDAGLRRVRARFTAERMVARTLAVYERLADTVREAGIANPSALG
jgi:glycosyltransferase involved in cell wall biosynthesis